MGPSSLSTLTEDRWVFYDWMNFAWPGRYNNGPNMPRPLAMVCRQLHQETSLLPLESNLFSFNQSLVMNMFLKFLKPVQIRALRSLAFSSPYTYERPRKADFEQLNSLCEVFISIPHNPNWGDDLDCNWRENESFKQEVESWQIKCGQVKVVHREQDKCETCRSGD